MAGFPSQVGELTPNVGAEPRIAFLRSSLSAPNGLMRAPDILRDGAHSNQRSWNIRLCDAITDIDEATPETSSLDNVCMEDVAQRRRRPYIGAF
jgi:hypothetical protein